MGSLVTARNLSARIPCATPTKLDRVQVLENGVTFPSQSGDPLLVLYSNSGSRPARARWPLRCHQDQATRPVGISRSAPLTYVVSGITKRDNSYMRQKSLHGIRSANTHAHQDHFTLSLWIYPGSRLSSLAFAAAVPEQQLHQRGVDCSNKPRMRGESQSVATFAYGSPATICSSVNRLIFISARLRLRNTVLRHGLIHGAHPLQGEEKSCHDSRNHSARELYPGTEKSNRRHFLQVTRDVKI